MIIPITIVMMVAMRRKRLAANSQLYQKFEVHIPFSSPRWRSDCSKDGSLNNCQYCSIVYYSILIMVRYGRTMLSIITNIMVPYSVYNYGLWHLKQDSKLYW